MKECSAGKKVLVVKMSWNDPLDPFSQKETKVDSNIKDMG